MVGTYFPSDVPNDVTHKAREAQASGQKLNNKGQKQELFLQKTSVLRVLNRSPWSRMTQTFGVLDPETCPWVLLASGRSIATTAAAARRCLGLRGVTLGFGNAALGQGGGNHGNPCKQSGKLHMFK